MSVLGKYRGLAYLVALLVLLPLLAWRLALADTASQWRMARRMEWLLPEMREQAASPVASAAAVSATEQIRDGELLGEILCGPGCCEVVKYTPYLSGSTDGLTLHTAEVVLNTDYASLVRIVDNVECNMPQVRLRSVTLRAVTPRGSRQVQLYALLVIQQITGITD